MRRTKHNPEYGNLPERVVRMLEEEERRWKREERDDFLFVTLPLGLAGFTAIGTMLAIGYYLPALSASSARDTAGIIEEWSAANPTKQIPVTNDYISYPSYLSSLGLTEEDAPYEELNSVDKLNISPDEIMVKVSSKEKSGADYIVCSYVGDDDSNFYTFDSITGEAVKNELKDCS